MISVEIPLQDEELFHGLKKSHPEAVTIVRAKQFKGHPEVVQVLVLITPVVLPALVKIIVAHIRSKKNISVKANGVEIKGLTARNVLKVLKAVPPSPSVAMRKKASKKRSNGRKKGRA